MSVDATLQAVIETVLDPAIQERVYELLALLESGGSDRLSSEPEFDQWFGPFLPIDVVGVVGIASGSLVGLADDGEYEPGVTRDGLTDACEKLGLTIPEWNPDTEIDILDTVEDGEMFVIELLSSLDSQLDSVGARLLIIDVPTAEEFYLAPVTEAHSKALDGAAGSGFTLRLP